MSRSRVALESALAGTMLKDRGLVELRILDSDQFAYVLKISGCEIEAAWRTARSLFDATKFWPVVSVMWSGRGQVQSLQERLLDEDLFSRFYFEEAPNASDVSPIALCARSKKIDVGSFLIDKAARREVGFGVADALEYELESVERRCGEAPSTEQIKAGLVQDRPITTIPLLELLLKEWEESRGFQANPEDSRQSWFEDEAAVLVFLPIDSGWDALAYLSWYGASDFGSEYYIALGRSWEERFGAELVAHFGTMLQCLVSNPPKTFVEAWPLAVEHDLVAGCTLSLPGIKLRDYAHSLIGWEKWFLHDRP